MAFETEIWSSTKALFTASNDRMEIDARDTNPIPPPLMGRSLSPTLRIGKYLRNLPGIRQLDGSVRTATVAMAEGRQRDLYKQVSGAKVVM